MVPKIGHSVFLRVFNFLLKFNDCISGYMLQLIFWSAGILLISILYEYSFRHIYGRYNCNFIFFDASLRILLCYNIFVPQNNSIFHILTYLRLNMLHLSNFEPLQNFFYSIADPLFWFTLVKLNFRRRQICSCVSSFGSLMNEFSNLMFMFDIHNVTIFFTVAWRIRKTGPTFWISDNHCWTRYLWFGLFIIMVLLSIIIVNWNLISREIQLFIQDNILVDLQWLSH